jgi:hypothetical protein
MKKTLILLLVVFTSCKCTKPSKDEQIKTLTYQVDSLRLEIIEQWDFIETLKDEVKIARMEADYWGYKHDSILHTKEIKK